MLRQKKKKYKSWNINLVLIHISFTDIPHSKFIRQTHTQWEILSIEMASVEIFDNSSSLFLPSTLMFGHPANRRDKFISAEILVEKTSVVIKLESSLISQFYRQYCSANFCHFEITERCYVGLHRT